MLSFQGSLDQQTKTISYLETTSLSKKRKWDHFNDHNTSTAVVDLHLEKPLPLEWQRCLDIQSGEIHFYNTRTQKRTARDPRPSDVQRASHMSLDLKLNIACDNNNPSSTKPTTLSLFKKEEQEEMIAAACKRCHMLVVLCKSSPACPNCKFMHPLDVTPAPKLMIKPGIGLSC